MPSHRPKLDRLARSLPDARDIVEELTEAGVKLNIGGSTYDPNDPVGRLLFNLLAMIAEFESDLIKMRTREGMKVAKAKGRLRGKQPKLNPAQEEHFVELWRAGRHTSAELAELFSSPDPPSTARSSVLAADASAGSSREQSALTRRYLSGWGQLRESRFVDLTLHFGSASGVLGHLGRAERPVR